MKKVVSKNKGFTLLEVVAALFVAGVALTCLVSIETSSIKRDGKAKAKRQALILARKKLEEIKLGISSEGSGEFEGMEAYKWTAKKEPFQFGLFRLIVTVQFKYGKSVEEIELQEIVR